MTMLISANLIQSAVSGAMLQLPQAKAPQWSEDDLNRVEELLPFNSADEVGRILGRSGNAIKIIRLRRGIQASSKTDGWFTANQVRELLGMADGRPVIGWVKKGFVMGHQINGDSTWMINEISLRRWIASPSRGCTSIHRRLQTKNSRVCSGWHRHVGAMNGLVRARLLT